MSPPCASWSAAVRAERQPQRVENVTAREKISSVSVGVISAAGLGDTAAHRRSVKMRDVTVRK